MAVGNDARLGQAGCRLGQVLRRGRQVKADADDGLRAAPVGRQLDQNAGQLGELARPGQQHIVRPLQPDTGAAQAVQGPGQANPDRQRQAAQAAGITGKAPEQREGQAGFRRRQPAPPAPPPSGALPVGNDDRAGWRAPLGAAHQFAVGRVAFVQRVDVETPGQCAQPGLEHYGIDQCHATDFTPPHAPCRRRCRARRSCA